MSSIITWKLKTKNMPRGIRKSKVDDLSKKMSPENIDLVRAQKKKEEPPKEESKFAGFEQTYTNKDGKIVKLKNFLKEGDWWELKKQKRIVYIVLHDTVKRLADEVGILTDVQYSILTQPTYENNYQQTWQVRIVDHTGRATTETGEVNRGNLGPRGRSTPAAMAAKRAYDRAVCSRCGATDCGYTYD